MKGTQTEPTAVPRALLESPVEGRNLAPSRFGDQLEARTLLIFLRHLG